MVGNRFVVLAILLRLHTSFPWDTLTKAYKQWWKAFVVIILCAEYVADAFGSRSPFTTTQVMSTLLSKHLQEPGLDELRNRSHIIIRISASFDRVMQVARLLTFAVLALPFPRALFWLPPDCSPPARMRCGHLACRLGFSSVRESRGGRQKSSPLPATRFQQMPGQAGQALPRDRHSCEIPIIGRLES